MKIQRESKAGTEIEGAKFGTKLEEMELEDAKLNETELEVTRLGTKLCILDAPLSDLELSADCFN